MVGPRAPGSRTQVFAVLGHPITHTLSPVMHNAAFEELGLDAVYLAFDVGPDQVGHLLTSMQQMNFGGLNLTVPLKEKVQSVLTRVDPVAEAIGAVNTVVFADDGMVGHNTDGEGFVRAAGELDVELGGKRVVILGSGGAARAATLFSARAGAAEITLVARNQGAAAALVSELGVRHPGVAMRAVTEPGDQVAAVAQGEFVVQSTPVGLKDGDPPIVGVEAFHEGQAMLDMIYHVAETSTMKAARSAGARVANGLGMLLYQGALAFTLWTGRDAPIPIMRAALEKEVYGP